MPRRVAVLWRTVLGTLLGWVARCWLCTLRVHLVVHASLKAEEGRPWVFAFFHGTQWPLLAWRGRRPIVALVSLSLDGAMQARALSSLGLLVERGSSSRGGMRGLARVSRRLRGGGVDAAFAVDGPRGPRGVAKGGARVAARSAGGALVPVGSAFDRGFTLERTWDRFGVALPFSRVVVRLGAPMRPSGEGMTADSELQIAIARANQEAARVLESVIVPGGAVGVSK